MGSLVGLSFFKVGAITIDQGLGKQLDVIDLLKFYPKRVLFNRFQYIIYHKKQSYVYTGIYPVFNTLDAGK